MLNFRAQVVCPRTFLFAILIALPVCGRAADMSLDGGSGCTDPPITMLAFTMDPVTGTGVTGTGGMCKHFGNHTGSSFTTLSFTTAFPTHNLGVDPFLCSGGTVFEFCDFIVDGSPRHHSSGDFISSGGSTITVEFFGINSDHPGIPDLGPTAPLTADNFYLNLNNPVCSPAGICSQPNVDPGAGDWIDPSSPSGSPTGSKIVFAANVPEPASWMLLLSAAGALLARNRLRKPGSAAN